MKLRFEIEPGDLVRAAQKHHLPPLEFKRAEALLREFEDSITNQIEDIKRNVFLRILHKQYGSLNCR